MHNKPLLNSLNHPFTRKHVPNTKLGLTYLILLSMCIAGCSAVGPSYTQSSTPEPKQWQYAPSTNTSHNTQQLAVWWQQFNDPLLTTLIEEALIHNFDVKSAQAKLRGARAQRNLATSSHFPTVTTTLGASHSKNNGQIGNASSTSNSASANNKTLYNAGFDASWEPDIFGGTRRGVEAAEADLSATQADLYNTTVSLAAEVALNYIELRSNQQRVNIAQNNLATQTETLQITQWRAEAGLATSLDIEQARTNQAQTRAGIPTLSTAMIEAENRLATLLGTTPDKLHARLATQADLPQTPNELLMSIPADMLRQRPDVQAAERRLAAETARIGVESAARYPTFALSGSLGWQALTIGALGSGESLIRSLSGSVATTLFDGGRIRSRIEAQTAIQEQALANYEQTILTAIEEVENALASYANSHTRLQALDQATNSARNAALLARQRYESGLIDFQSVLDTERTRLSTEDTLVSVRAEGLTALIQLYKAMGGGWQGAVPSASSNPTSTIQRDDAS